MMDTKSKIKRINKMINQINKKFEIIGRYYYYNGKNKIDKKLGYEYIKKVSKISENLKYLYFGEPKSIIAENYNVDNLPIELTHLVLDCEFNYQIDNLPSTLTHLFLCDIFNQPIDYLPNSITHLVIGKNFNHPIDNLPNSITHLILGDNFNQSIDNLPKSIKFLVLGKNFNQSIKNIHDGIEVLFYCGKTFIKTDREKNNRDNEMYISNIK